MASEIPLILLAEPQVASVFMQLYHRVRHVIMVLVHADLQGVIILFADLSLVRGTHRSDTLRMLREVLILAELQLQGRRRATTLVVPLGARPLHVRFCAY